MDKQQFLSLCDPHNSIIHQFGCEGCCTRSAGICLRGCNQYQHQENANRHQFLPAREFYSIVGSIRQRYESFQVNFRQVYLKRYMEEVRACMESFQSYIFGEFLEKNPIIDIFCKYSSGGDAFQQLLEQKLDEIEFAEVRCRDVFQLRHFEQVLQRQGSEERQRRIMRLFSKVFEHHLRTHKILLTQKQNQERRIRHQEMIEAAQVDGLAEALQRKVNHLEYTQRQEKVEELLLILRANLEDYEQSTRNGQGLAKLFGNLQNYFEKTLPQRLVLAVNFPLTSDPFWMKLTDFIGSNCLKQVGVWTTAEPLPSKEVEGQLTRRYEGIVPITIRHCAKWQDVSALMDKRKGISQG